MLVDEAHWNTHTSQGLYRPLARLLSSDGYRLSRNRQALIPELLDTCEVLLVANPRGLSGLRFGGAAFAQGEVEAVRSWVREGGGLLLIADRAPSIDAARPIAEAFGIEIGDRTLAASGEEVPQAHPIRYGRSEANEQVGRLALFPGPALRTGSSRAVEIVASRSVAIESGKGRVVVMTDAGALTAQIVEGKRRGINAPEVDNDQLALNILHWLSKLI